MFSFIQPALVIFSDRISCNDPGHPVNGQRIGSLFWIGSVVRFTCDDGHVIQGASNITCDETGHWDSDPPTCVAGQFPYLYSDQA